MAWQVIALRTMLAAAAVTTLTGSLVVSCAGDSEPGSGTDGSGRPNSAAMGLWSPDPQLSDECPKKLHDKYFVLGPDGKKYPTWHPPTDVDPDKNNQPCYYGHEHGPNPSSLALFADLQKHFAFDANSNSVIDSNELEQSGIPFGYAMEQIAGAQPQAHSAWKIIGADDVQRQIIVNGQQQSFDLLCQQVMVVNHDVVSSDAFNANAHEMIYALNCNSGTEATNFAPKVIANVVAAFGSAASFELGAVGASAPAQQTTSATTRALTPPIEVSLGNETPPRRYVPDSTRVFQNTFVGVGASSNLASALRERWDALVVLRSGSTELARLNPSVQTNVSTRYYDGSATPAKAIDLCYSGLNSAGLLVTDPLQSASIVRQVRGSTLCSSLNPTGPNTTVAQRIASDARKSPFKGCDRLAIFRQQSISNGTGPEVWYTDAFGQNGSRTANNVAKVRQFIAPINTASRNVVLAPVEFAGTTPDCDEGSGVRADVN